MRLLMHKVQRLWLIAFSWLLGLLTVSAGGSSITFNYDCEIRGLTAHDAQIAPASVYDRAAIFTANECRNRPDQSRALFIEFAKFLAAENTTATQLEFPFVKDLSAKPPIQWPPNGGFAGDPAAATLVPGTTIDRFGLAKGSYVSPTGTPFIQRSLAPGTQYSPYNIYTVLKPIDVQAGPIAPAFGMPGGGIQFKLPSSVQSFIDSGHLGVGN